MAVTTTSESVTRALRRCFAQFPHVKGVMKRLETLLAYQCFQEEAEHIMLLGESGVGKSTLLKRFRDKYPPIEYEEYTEIPVLYVEVPAVCSIKKLANTMLQALGSQYWNKGNEIELTHQLRCLLQGCRVRMVILDEVNHLVERGGVKTHHNIADWIKRLSDEVRLPFVLAGIPRAQRLLNTNDQLRSRFREVIVIPPFSMETEMVARQFCGVLKTFGGLLKDVSSIQLSHPDIAHKFIFATGGRLREIRKLFVRAVELAFEDTVPKLTIAVLARAFATVIYPCAPDDRNPFHAKFKKIPLVKPGEPFAPREE